jgi:hypothetical protein
MRRLVIGLLLWGAVLTAGPIDGLDVVIYPEYSYPGVIVEYSGEISPENLPVTFRFLVPDEIDSSVSVVEQEGGENDIRSVNIIQINGEKWGEVTINQEHFRIFSFFVPFETTKPERDFTYRLKFDRDLENLHLAVQKPLVAEKFSLSQTEYETFKDQHGIEFYRVHIGSLPAGQVKEITVAYQNPTGRTTLHELQAMLSRGGRGNNGSTATGFGEAPKRHRLLLWQPVTVLGLLAVVIGFLYWKFRPAVQVAEVPVSRAAPAKKKLFCSACGTELRVGDKFCYNCGHKVEIPRS